MKGRPGTSEAVTNYWMKYFIVPTPAIPSGVCGLCANTGTVDTTQSAVTSHAKEKAGIRTFCICPNGQALRSMNERVK